MIILHSRIATLLLKGYFRWEKTNFHEKNLKYSKIILSIDFIFAPTFFLIASYQILKNHAILIKYKSLFQGKDSVTYGYYQLNENQKVKIITFKICHHVTSRAKGEGRLDFCM